MPRNAEIQKVKTISSKTPANRNTLKAKSLETNPKPKSAERAAPRHQSLSRLQKFVHKRTGISTESRGKKVLNKDYT